MRHAVRALIVHDTEPRVLLARRSPGEKYAAKQWALLGGKVDRGETGIQAVIREVHEESGLRFIPEALFVAHENNEWRTEFYYGKAIGTLVLKQAEHDQARYCTESELSAVPLAFDHESILRSFFRTYFIPDERRGSA